MKKKAKNTKADHDTGFVEDNTLETRATGARILPGSEIDQEDESASPAVEERRLSAYDEYMLAMAEEASHGDTDDEDVDDANRLTSDDDAADERYLVESEDIKRC